MELFPYEPRPMQEQIVDYITANIEKGRPVVIESGTGTGKTVCSLAAVLPFAKNTGRKVFYLTRTQSQQKQVMLELQQISKQMSVFGLALQGRASGTCPYMADNRDLATATPEEMSRLCVKLKKHGDNGRCGCKYYQNLLENDIDSIIQMVMYDMPDPEELQRRCRSVGICPYEVAKAAIPYTDIIAVPYVFIVNDRIVNHLLDWMGVRIEDTVIVVDEAHNLPDYLRESYTSEYTLRALDYVEKEAADLHDPEVASGISVRDVVSSMRRAFGEAAVEYLVEDDGLIPFGFLQESLMDDLHVPSTTLHTVCKSMIEIGEILKEQKKEKLKIPRSYIGNLGMFLEFWMICDDECYVRLINGGDNPSFEAYCMDPYEAARPFRDCHSSVHMSGTLEPLMHYCAELGLRNPAVRSFPSPFDPDNLLTLYVGDVTTRHKDLQIDPDNISRIKDYTVEIVNGVGRNTAVFFPSYDMMDRFIKEGLDQEIEGRIFMERRGMSQTELMESVDEFRSSSCATLFAVTGGRISEGVDFPSRDLELAVIIGLPYPRPCFKKEALIRYADNRYGDGWETVVKTPMIRKIRQARGRLIRSEDDMGVAVVLDSRATQIPGFNAFLTDDPLRDALAFFDGDITPSSLAVRNSL